jgi:hypothetical protein
MIDIGSLPFNKYSDKDNIKALDVLVKYCYQDMILFSDFIDNVEALIVWSGYLGLESFYKCANQIINGDLYKEYMRRQIPENDDDDIEMTAVPDNIESL